MRAEESTLAGMAGFHMIATIAEVCFSYDHNDYFNVFSSDRSDHMETGFKSNLQGTRNCRLSLSFGPKLSRDLGDSRLALTLLSSVTFIQLHPD